MLPNPALAGGVNWNVVACYCCMYLSVCVFLQYDEEGEEADDEVRVFTVHYVCIQLRDTRLIMCACFLGGRGGGR